MAQVTNTAKGFKLVDSQKFKGKSLELEFGYEIEGETEHKSSAGYYDKFRAYYAQEAAQAWNKAKSAAAKKLQSEFDKADKEATGVIDKFFKGSIDAAKAKQEIERIENDQKRKLSEALLKRVQKDIGADFVPKAHAAAEKRIQKEGEKLKKSKAKIAVKIVKLVLKVAAIAAATAATVASGGAAAPVLVAVAGWVAFGGGAAKKLVEGAKIVDSLRNDARSHCSQMEKMLAELDEKFAKCVKFANKLHDEADAIEMREEELMGALLEGEKALSQMDRSNLANFKAIEKAEKDARKKIDAAAKLKIKRHDMRAYAQTLRGAFNEFRKVKNDADWGHKIDTTKSVAATFKDAGKVLDVVVGLVAKEG